MTLAIENTKAKTIKPEGGAATGLPGPEAHPWQAAHTGPLPPIEARRWVMRMVGLCRPDKIYWCSGSKKEKAILLAEAVEQGVLLPLNETKLPGCYLHRSNPNDVARTEQCTFICTPGQDTAGPTNNWMESGAAYAK